MHPSSATRDFVHRLLTEEIAIDPHHLSEKAAAFRLYERIRQQLRSSMGSDGFRALASRALMLARIESPTLAGIEITADGSLRSSDDLILADKQGESGIVLVAYFLELFHCLLGTKLTLHLVQEMFPRLEDTAVLSSATPLESMLQEVCELRNVSQRLESLAEVYPAVEHALCGISANINDIGTILELFALVRYKFDGLPKIAPKEQLKRYLM